MADEDKAKTQTVIMRLSMIQYLRLTQIVDRAEAARLKKRKPLDRKKVVDGRPRIPKFELPPVEVV